MIALFILLFLLLFVALVCLIKVRFVAIYDDSLKLKLKVLFLTFQLVPHHKKKKKKKSKKTKKSADKKEKKPSYVKKLSDKKGVDGIVSIVVDLAKLVGTTLKGLTEKTVVEKMDISITVVGDDAADTALRYGRICGVFYSAVAVVCGTAKCDEYTVEVTPDFSNEADARVCADVRFYIRAYYVLSYALKVLYKLIMIRYKR